MKQIVSLMVAIFVTLSSFSQIENIKISSDSSINVNKLYAGMLSSTAFNTKSLTTTPSINLRVGAMVSWKVSKQISIKSFGMIETDLIKTWGIQQFYLSFTPSKHWLLVAGQMATISTEQRPHPVSGNGQFETWTQARIPGGAPGFKFKYVGNITVGAGIAVRNGAPEYHGSFAKGNHTISGYYRDWDGQKGFAYTYDSKKFYSLLVFIPSSTVATTTVVNFKNDYSLFVDLGYGAINKTLVRGEVGALKSFSSKWLKGLFSLSYDIKTESVNGYLFVHL